MWLQFYMRLGLHDTGIAQGLDDGDHIHVFDKQVSNAGQRCHVFETVIDCLHPFMVQIVHARTLGQTHWKRTHRRVHKDSRRTRTHADALE